MSTHKIKDINLKSEEVQDIFSKVPHWIIRWGNFIYLVFILLLIILSWFIKYPDVIASQAIITTQIQPQKEYAKTSGKLDVIFVKNNETISMADPIAIIENTANYNDVFKLKAIIDTIQINYKTFSFPLDNIPVLFLGDIESSYAAFENSYIKYQLNKELQPFLNIDMANTYSITALNHRLKNLYTQIEINKHEIDLKRKDLNRQKTLFDKGIISAQKYESKQMEYDQFSRTYKNIENSISEVKDLISKARTISKGTEINYIKEEKELLKHVIQAFNQLKKSIKDWEYKYLLKSNIKGKVSFFNYWTSNQMVYEGDLLFTVVPIAYSPFIAKLKAPVRNSGKIQVGQIVNIKLENYPDTEFGILKGKVANISLMPDDDGLFLIDVLLSKKLITTYNKEIAFKQEMSGSAEIITKDLRLLERLFYSFKELWEH